MSIKRMVTKLALAFAAKKGMEAFRGMGGMAGVQSALKSGATPAQDVQRGGTSGRIGGASDGNSNGLGNILGSLGLAGATNDGDRAPGNSIGAVLGSLASAFGAPTPEAKDDLETQFNDTATLSDQDAAPVLRAMVQMARADGSIDDDEQAALFDILDDANEAEKATLTAALREPVDPRGLAADTPPHARKEVYSAALLIGSPDTAREHEFLQTLARGLDLDQSDLDRMHSAMGKTRVVLA